MNRSSADTRLCAPLLDALQLMQQWVLRDGASRLIVVTPTLSELKRQSLPAHVSLSIKKRRGPRVAIRGPRQYRNTSLVTAKWPDDAQHAIVMPTLICVISGQADFHIADTTASASRQSGLSLSVFTQPTLTVILSNAATQTATSYTTGGNPNSYSSDGYFYAPIDTGLAYIPGAVRHLDGANMAFADGHAKWYKGNPDTEIMSSVYGAGTPGSVSGSNPTFNPTP